MQPTPASLPRFPQETRFSYTVAQIMSLLGLKSKEKLRRPTNGEFIAVITDKLALEQRSA